MSRPLRLLAPPLLALLSGACNLPLANQYGDPTSEVDMRGFLHLGEREAEHETLGEHTVYGFDFEVDPRVHPFSFELGVTAADETTQRTGGKTQASYSELFFGSRYYLERVYEARPYVGFGFDFLTVDRRLSGPGGRVTEEDSGMGLYARLGAHRRVHRFGYDRGLGLFVGGDMRVVFGQDHQLLEFTLMMGLGR